MTTPDDRVPTTHIGSLPRPPELLDLLTAKEDGEDVDPDEWDGAVDDGTSLVAAPDCGFGTQAGIEMVEPEIVWAKLEALGEGAEIASERIDG